MHRIKFKTLLPIELFLSEIIIMEQLTGLQTSFLGTWIGTGQQKTASTNDIINAYLEGRRDGEKEAFKELFKMLFSNIEFAQEITEGFFHEINKNKKVCYKAFLSFDDISNFKVIFQINNDVFYSEAVDELYKKAMEIRNKKNSEDFNISISFIPMSTALNENRLQADGFVLSYAGK